jgi:hypothetical protein
VTLSKYSIALQEDRKHLREVSNPRLAQTPFRSPQLTLIDLGPHEWLLYWRVSPYAPRHHMRRARGIVQLPLFAQEVLEKVAGGEETGPAARPRDSLHLLPKLTLGQEPPNT